MAAVRRRAEVAEDDDAPDHRAAWAVIWRRQMVVGVAVFVVAIGPLIGVGLAYHPKDPPTDVAAAVFSVAGVCIAGALLFSLKNWRCPACHRYMGKRAFGIRFCPGCGARLG
jgi:hypothetical protein